MALPKDPATMTAPASWINIPGVTYGRGAGGFTASGTLPSGFKVPQGISREQLDALVSGTDIPAGGSLRGLKVGNQIWGQRSNLLNYGRSKGWYPESSGSSFGDTLKGFVTGVPQAAFGLAKETAPVWGGALAGAYGSGAFSSGGGVAPSSAGASFPGVGWQAPESGVLAEGSSGAFPGVATQAPGSGVLSEGAVAGAALNPGASSGIDLGITAPAFTSSPQLTATGVSGSGLPVGALPSSSAFPSTQGPFSGDFGGPSDTGPLASRLPAGGGMSEAPTLANKFLSSGVGKFAAKYGLPLAALGTQLLGRPKIPEMGALSGRAAEMEKAGQADIASARAGNLTPAQQAGIDKFKSDQMSSVKQYMANSGQGMDSTSFLQLKANVDQQALAMSQGFLDQLMSQGLNELGLADSAESQLINIRMQREQETSAAFNNFLFSYGLLGGFGGGK